MFLAHRVSILFARNGGDGLGNGLLQNVAGCSALLHGLARPSSARAPEMRCDRASLARQTGISGRSARRPRSWESIKRTWIPAHIDALRNTNPPDPISLALVHELGTTLGVWVVKSGHSAPQAMYLLLISIRDLRHRAYASLLQRTHHRIDPEAAALTKATALIDESALSKNASE